jgi:transmembrane sensor
MKYPPEFIADLLAREAAKQFLDDEERRALDMWRGRRGERPLKVPKEEPPPVRRIPWRRIGAAAAVLLIVVVGVGLYRGRVRQSPMVMDAAADWLVWSDGSKVKLTGAPVGAIISRVGDDVVSMADSDIVVINQQHAGTRATGWARVVTGSRQKPMQLRMADGSTVSLSGNSQFQFPLDDRTAGEPCQLSGNAFFDIKDDPHRPFSIELPNHSRIQLLGTIFIVEASETNPVVRISLFSGDLRIQNVEGATILHPNQVARVSANWVELRNMRDTTEMKGWGFVNIPFQFGNTPLVEVLRQVAAWHGCTVENPHNIRGIALTGKMWRSGPLDSTLAMINAVERENAELKLEGKVIVVCPPSH